MRDRYANLRHGLVGAWCPSIAGSGFTLPDLSGYGNHGTLTNMAADDWVSEQYGRALDFDGSNDYINAGNSSNLFLLNTNFTLSCWARLVGGAGTFRVMISQDQSQVVNANTYEIGLSGSNAFYYYPGNLQNIYGNTFIPALNRWYHYAAVAFMSSGSIIVLLYVDGSVTNTLSQLLAPVNPGTGALHLGVDAPTGFNQGSFFNGRLDDIRIYNRALSASEIRLLAQRPGIGLVPQRRAVYDAPSTFNAGRLRRQQLIGSGVY